MNVHHPIWYSERILKLWQRCDDIDYHVRIFIIETSINGVDRSTKNLIVILKLDNRNWKVKEITKYLLESFIFV